MSDGSTADWRALVARCRAGERAAQDEIVLLFQDRVRARVHKELQDDFRKHHAWMLALFSTRDVVQDVLCAVVSALGSGDFADEDAFAGYLATMARNRLLDAVRHHEAQKRDARREVRDLDPELVRARSDQDLPTPALAAQLAEQAGLVNEVLDALDPRRRALITLRLVDEKSYPVIAQELGYASAETARQAFVEAQARLLVKLRARGLRAPGETLR